jgi:hypothetical protein
MSRRFSAQSFFLHRQYPENEFSVDGGNHRVRRWSSRSGRPTSYTHNGLLMKVARSIRNSSERFIPGN